jgi:hypothetical protein
MLVGVGAGRRRSSTGRQDTPSLSAAPECDSPRSSLSLRHRLLAPVLTRLVGKQPCVTFVTLGELTQWAELRQWGRRNRDALENWLGGVIILPCSEDVART